MSDLKEAMENVKCPHCGANVYLNFLTHKNHLVPSHRCPKCKEAYKVAMDPQFIVATAAAVILMIAVILTFSSGFFKALALLLCLGLLVAAHYLAFLFGGFRFVVDNHAE